MRHRFPGQSPVQRVAIAPAPIGAMHIIDDALIESAVSGGLPPAGSIADTRHPHATAPTVACASAALTQNVNTYSAATSRPIGLNSVVL